MVASRGLNVNGDENESDRIHTIEFRKNEKLLSNAKTLKKVMKTKSHPLEKKSCCWNFDDKHRVRVRASVCS